MKKRYVFSLFALIFGGFLWYENNALETNTYVLKSGKLPENFDGFSIAHISDLHNKSFGKGQKKLIKKLEDLSPHIIAVTGDIINKRTTSMENALAFLEKAVDIAPLYFTPGNHEIQFAPRRKLYREMESLGVTILINQREILEVYGERINLWGVDPMNEYVRCLKKIYGAQNEFNIVLAHRPDRFKLYWKSNADLVLSGHAHGGLISIGGKPLYAPNQGFYPKYTQGAYVKGNTTMIVSRGLGSAVVPLRIGNKPEIVEIILKKTKP